MKHICRHLIVEFGKWHDVDTCVYVRIHVGPVIKYLPVSVYTLTQSCHDDK